MSASFPSGLFTPTEKAALNKLGVRDLDELVRTPPRRYVTPGPLSSLDSLREGEDVSVIAQVTRTSTRRMANRPGHILTVHVRDELGASTALTFFLHKQQLLTWHQSRLTEGTHVLVSGTVRLFRGEAQIAHPDYIVLDDPAQTHYSQDIERALSPAPVYPLRAHVSQKTMRSAFAKAVSRAHELEDPLPAMVRRGRSLPRLADAAQGLHQPRHGADIEAARHYFRFEEAFIIQTIFARRRAQDAADAAPVLATNGPLAQGLDARIPFALTQSQRDVGNDLASFIAREHPTSVLLQGDVGSGKTIVALRAMARAVDSGYQAAFLAPTEVLARQHFHTITGMLGDLARAGHLDAHPHATRVRLLTGSLSVPERREALSDALSGQAGIIVGTHALLSENVEFFNLGLVVIDEQHRFGVDHRRHLRSRGKNGQRPHMIVMTATPIPRTAALSLVGDVDSLTLEQRERTGARVSSHVVPLRDRAWRERMFERVREEIVQGRQAFIVCPRIDPQDDSAPQHVHGDASDPDPAGMPDAAEFGVHGVTDTARMLRERDGFHALRIEELHGRLSTDEKKQRMAGFAAGEIDILVATTVIEVGVDVPNASVMLVLDAERFGLAQLHQLRGRIGRGEHPGIAFFATQCERSSPQYAHLDTLASTTDGYALAELDLHRRGSGDLVGDVQSGVGVSMRFLDVIRDAAVIADAREDAFLVEALRRGSLEVSDAPSTEEYDALSRALATRAAAAETLVERS